MSLISNVTSVTNSRLLGVLPLKIKCSIPEGLKKQRKGIFYQISTLKMN